MGTTPLSLPACLLSFVSASVVDLLTLDESVLWTGHPHALTFRDNWHPTTLSAMSFYIWFWRNISLAPQNGHSLVATTEGRRGQLDFAFLLRCARQIKYETLESLAGQDFCLCGLNCSGQTRTHRVGDGE